MKKIKPATPTRPLVTYRITFRVLHNTSLRTRQMALAARAQDAVIMKIRTNSSESSTAESVQEIMVLCFFISYTLKIPFKLVFSEEIYK